MEGINIENFRSVIRKKFDEKIQDETTSVNLEKAIYNYTINEANLRKIVKKWDNPLFFQLYSDRLFSIYINMKNEKIITALKSKELGPKTFAFMTHQEMNPDRWKELLEKKRMIDKSKYNTDLVANTDMFTCSKCKSKKCNYYTLQTRSADEPETIFITCLDCGKNWKR